MARLDESRFLIIIKSLNTVEALRRQIGLTGWLAGWVTFIVNEISGDLQNTLLSNFAREQHEVWGRFTYLLSVFPKKFEKIDYFAHAFTKMHKIKLLHRREFTFASRLQPGSCAKSRDETAVRRRVAAMWRRSTRRRRTAGVSYALYRVYSI